MTSPYDRSQNPSSGHRSTPDRSTRSSGYASSGFRTPQRPTPSSGGQNPMAAAARSVVGLFTACFTPPEPNNSKSVTDSEEFKSTSGTGFDISLISWKCLFSWRVRCERALFLILWISEFEFLHKIVHVFKRCVLFGCWENGKIVKNSLIGILGFSLNHQILVEFWNFVCCFVNVMHLGH